MGKRTRIRMKPGPKKKKKADPVICGNCDRKAHVAYHTQWGVFCGVCYQLYGRMGDKQNGRDVSRKAY